MELGAMRTMELGAIGADDDVMDAAAAAAPASYGVIAKVRH